MKSLILGSALAVLVFALPVYAQIGLQAVEVDPESSATLTASSKVCWHNPTKDDPQSRAPNEEVNCDDSRCNEGPCTVSASVGATAETKIEPVAIPSHTPEWTHQNDSDPGTTEAKESGEKGGTADINIGVGELQGSAQRNQTDLEFATERASAVSVSAVEVRGWDPEKKEALRTEVKAQAQVHSGQDLEKFAAGLLLEHENVSAVEADESSVTVRSRVPARLLGIFKTDIDQETSITFGDGEHGRVKVKFPWTRVFYSVDDEYQEESLADTLLPEIDDEVLVKADSETEVSITPAVQASIIARVVARIAIGEAGVKAHGIDNDPKLGVD